MIFSVYKITNVLNGVSYVGQTKNDIKERWWHHLEKKEGGSFLKRAIQSFGKDNFKIEILTQCESKKEALKLESQYILKYNTLHPNGYNRKVMVDNKLVCEPELEQVYRKSYSLHLNQTGRKRHFATSKFRGVSFCKGKVTKFQSMCRIGGSVNLGVYRTEKEAAIVFDLYVLSQGKPELINFQESKSLFKNITFDQFKKNNSTKRSRTSKFIGVCWSKKVNKWMARHKKKFVGYFLSEEEAGEAVKQYQNNLTSF